jgi:hypothetical protein
MTVDMARYISLEKKNRSKFVVTDVNELGACIICVSSHVHRELHLKIETPVSPPT